MSNWIEIGTLNDIPVLGSRVVRTASGDIAVFRTADDEVFALDDRCPHKGGPLSQGIVHNKRVTCPLHNRRFDLRTGAALGAYPGVDAHEVVERDGDLWLRAPRQLEQGGEKQQKKNKAYKKTCNNFESYHDMSYVSYIITYLFP